VGIEARRQNEWLKEGDTQAQWRAGTVVHIYNPSYSGSLRSEAVQAKSRPYLKNKLKQKKLGLWFK
jgi:hypothetical protein